MGGVGRGKVGLLLWLLLLMMLMMMLVSLLLLLLLFPRLGAVRMVDGSGWGTGRRWRERTVHWWVHLLAMHWLMWNMCLGLDVDL